MQQARNRAMDNEVADERKVEEDALQATYEAEKDALKATYKLANLQSSSKEVLECKLPH